MSSVEEIRDEAQGIAGKARAARLAQQGGLRSEGSVAALECSGESTFDLSG